jgi:chromosome segregation ATPase
MFGTGQVQKIPHFELGELRLANQRLQQQLEAANARLKELETELSSAQQRASEAERRAARLASEHEQMLTAMRELGAEATLPAHERRFSHLVPVIRGGALRRQESA